MHYRQIISLLTIFISLVLLSCDKNYNKTAATITSDFAEEKARTDSVLKSIAGQTKIFTLNPSKKNTITSKKGIKFSIPANAFITKNGSKPKAKVQVTISEYHNPADILVSKIPMQYERWYGTNGISRYVFNYRTC